MALQNLRLRGGTYHWRRKITVRGHAIPLSIALNTGSFYHARSIAAKLEAMLEDLRVAYGQEGTVVQAAQLKQVFKDALRWQLRRIQTDQIASPLPSDDHARTNSIHAEAWRFLAQHGPNAPWTMDEHDRLLDAGWSNADAMQVATFLFDNTDGAPVSGRQIDQYADSFGIAKTKTNVSAMKRIICEARAAACRKATETLSPENFDYSDWIDEALEVDDPLAFEEAGVADPDPSPPPRSHPKETTASSPSEPEQAVASSENKKLLRDACEDCISAYVAEGAAIGSSKKVVEPNDVLLSRIVPHIRRSWVVAAPSAGRRQIASGEWIIFRSERVYPPYLRHVLLGDTFHAAFMGTVAGVGGSLLRARPEAVKRIAVALPPLPEQRRIAAILDQADALRSLRRQSVSRLSDLGQAIFFEMFGDPSLNPKRFQMGTIRDLLTEAKYGTAQKANSNGQGLPILRMSNLTYQGHIDLTDMKHVDLSVKDLPKYTTRAGDLLFNRTNSRELVGKTAVVEHDQRPIIFYTNGYDHWIWDDLRYPPRAIAGFLSRDELQRMVQRRDTRLPLADVPTSRAIAGGGGRTYQEKSIRAVCHRFEDAERDGENHRKALLVMATGSGKTRVAIAASDVLMRANWAKRILFLADRVPLVKQAASNFRKHLPDSSPVNLVMHPYADGRVYVSTYPTMMNLIERGRQDGKQRFGPGYFDLVIIDEAHRSVYRKYKAIFDWFDAPLLGLTATPKDEIDKNTYSLFELEDGVPTDAYDLKQAVTDGFLVPPKAIDVPLQYPRSGIRYDDLTDAEKDEWDALDWGEDGPPDEVGAADVNDWLFNVNTIDQMLKQLMEDGLKVAGGDRLGKTIIFAKNHNHAKFIVKRFDANFPALRGHFCRLIDNKVPYAHSLIEDFEEPEKAPHIAVSVDMLDTGIDIPDVLNLVFFKIVRSKSKFWQMIGRGTRLREGIFVDPDGNRADKEFFYVFDYLGNLDFFNAQMEGAQARAAVPLGERLFAARVDLIGLMRPKSADGTVRSPASGFRGEHDEPGLYEGVRTELQQQVAGMPNDNFIVRQKRRYVEKFQDASAWANLGEEDRHELVEHLAGLPTSVTDPDTDAKRFDFLCLRIQLSILRGTDFAPLRKAFIEQVHQLEAKNAVPDVAKHMALILEVQTDEWWTDATPEMVEVARRRLRGLMSLIEPGKQVVVTTNVSDVMGVKREVELVDLGGASSLAQFRRKARAYVDQHADHVTLARLRQGRPLTPSDLDELQKLFIDAGLAESSDFQRIRQMPDMPEFIRSLIGLDRRAAQAAFNDALAGTTLSPRQIHFVEMIVDYLTASGKMDPAALYEPPFTDAAPNGVSDIFDGTTVTQIVNTLEGFEPRLDVAL